MPDKKLKLFISYSRNDELLVNLLLYILEKEGFDCQLDKKLKTGNRFDFAIQQMICEADIVLLNVTTASAKSCWVQQEIGFSIGKSKKFFMGLIMMFAVSTETLTLR